MRLRFSPCFCAVLIVFNALFAFAAPTPTDKTATTTNLNTNSSGTETMTTLTGSPGTLINLNTASVTELAKLPGVDEKIARAIIAGRPYTHIDDLQRNPKLSKTEISKIKNLVTIK